MLFALFITVFSFKVLKSNQGQLEETSKSVVIQNSNFQSRQFSNANNLHKSNKFTNAKISNSNFKFKGSKDHALVLQLVDFSNNTIELDEDFESSPIELGSGKSSIFNLTLKNINYKDNSVGIFSFDSTDIELTQLKCKGKLMSTLFKGPVTGFSLKDSTIEGFAKDKTHEIRAAIFLSHITCTDSKKRFDFINNNFINNQIQVFELDKAIDNNVLIQESTFQKNKASSGSCILISSKSGARNTGMIDISNNTFTENENSGDSGIVGGALKINTQQAKFTGDNYFSKNDCYYDGSSSSSEASGAYGGSIFITQTRLSPITLTGLHFEGDASSHAGGAIFVYGYDEGGQTELNSVTISGCTFTKCHSDQFGGGFATGIEKSNGDVVGNNDVKISDCTFTECSAGTGGSIYVALGSAKGGESTAIEDCTFENCTASKASAIYSGSIEFTMKGSTFKNQGEKGKVSNSNMILLSIKDAGGKANIEDCTFDSCYHAVLGASEDSDKSNIITFENCKFTGNTITSERGSFRGVFDLSYIKSVSLNLVSCNFTKNFGFCIIAEKGICKTTINNCLFQDNGGSHGCIIYITKDSATDSQEYITFIDSQFIDHMYTVQDTGRANGVMHIPLNFVAFDGTNTFISNSAIFNGKGTSKGNSAIGGSIFFECSTDKNVYLSNLVFENSASSNYGGAIAFLYEPSGSAQLKLSLTLQNCKFTQCTANTGGAIYIDDNDRAQYEIFINRCTFNKCDAYYGSSLYCQASKFELSHSIFEEMSRDGNAKPTLIHADLTHSSENKVINCSFNKINEIIDIKSTSSSTISFSKCNYTNNCMDKKSNKYIIMLDRIQCDTINFDECTFKENGGICILQEDDNTHNVNIKKCLFTRNVGLPGCAIYASTSDKVHIMTVEDCTFSYNKVTSESSDISGEGTNSGFIVGAVVARSNSIDFRGTNTFDHNEVYSDNTEYEFVMAHGGSLAIIQNYDELEEYKVSNLVFTDSYSQHYAGAIVILTADYKGSDQSKKSSFIHIENCKFNNCRAGKQGGAIRCGILYPKDDEYGTLEHKFDNDVNITNCQFTKCKAPEGGALYFLDGDSDGDEETIVRYCTFDGCKGFKGSAISCSSYKFDLAYTTFRNSKLYEDKDYKAEEYEIQSVLHVNHNEGGISPVILNCSFYNNEQGLDFYASGTSLDDENQITFKQCNFTKNNQASGENIQNPFIDLQYIQTSSISFEDCLFDNNFGPCIQQENNFICTTKISKCTFNKNSGFRGSCIVAYNSIIDSNPFMTVEDCIFKENKASEKGGAVFAETLAVIFTGVNQFISNAVRMNGDDSDTYSKGGSIYLAQQNPAVYTLSNCIFTYSSSGNEGGAIMVMAGDIEGKDPTISKDLFITIENCTFNSCSAGRLGGAIRCGQEGRIGGEDTFDNDINISCCKFSQCSASEGGALYFQDGDKEGDEETIIEYCTFEGCFGSKGSCILCLSYKFELSHTIFRGSRQVGETAGGTDIESFLYSKQNEGGIVVTVTNCTFEDNEQNIEMESAGQDNDGAETKGTITFKDCKFLKNNKEAQGPNSIIDLQYIISELTTFENCLFEENGGTCIKQDDIAFADTRIYKCVFNKNSGFAGCAICSLSHSFGDKKIVVEDCDFTNNKPTQPVNGYYGAVIAYSKVIEFKGTNKFENNEVHSIRDAQDEVEMAFGGSLVIFQDPGQPEEYTVSGIEFINSYSQHFGGAIAIFAGDFKEGGSGAKSAFVTIENCKFTNCSSGKQGGAIRCGLESEDRNEYDNDVKISHCQFTKCKAPEGTLYFQDGDKDGDEETIIEYCTFEGCIGSKGSCILCLSYKFELSHTIFRGSRKVGKVAEGTEVESFLYSKQNEGGIAPVVTNCTFEDNEQNIEFYSMGEAIEVDAASEITFKDCKFLKNNIESNGADTIIDLNYIFSSKITFEGCLFEENAGRCISQDVETLCSTHVKGCTFNNNHGGSGCALYLIHSESNTDHYMTVEDCIFSKNKALFYMQARGIICADTLAIRFEGVNKFIDNEVRQESEDTSNSMGGSLFLIQREPAAYEIKNLEFTNSYSDGYGGAIHIFAGDVEGKDDPKPTSLFITIKNCKFDSCKAAIQGGAIRMGDPSARPENTKDNDINISFCEFVNCEALEGGALYFMDGDMEGDEETVVEYSKFDKCKGATGSAVYCQSYKFQLAHTIFQNSKPYGKKSEMSEIESVLFVYLNEAGIEPVIKNCTFINNEQNIEVQSHGPIAGVDLVSSIKFLESHFIMNNQESNGADTILDLQHIQSQYVIFEKCDFKDNAGCCLKQDTEWVCNTNVTYCTFERNHGGAGCAIFAVSSRSDNLPLMTIDNCAFIENTVKSSWGARGGAVQVSTLAATFTGVNRFDKNQAMYEGEMGRSIPSFWQAAAGGALYIIQETDLKFELRDAVFTECSADHYGGAVVLSCLEDEDLISKLFIDIINCQFAGCTAARGGAICSTIEGTIKIEECKFFSDSAEDGGSIYVTDDTTDTPSTIDITKCFFDKSTSTNSGGAIYCKSGSIIAAANNFTNCQSDSKAAVMYLSAHSSTTLGNNYIEMNKKQGVSAIYYTSTNPQSILWMDGGCYSSTKSGHDTSADILVFESTGKIEFRNKPCFSGTKEESIQIIGNQALNLPGEYFNCHECEPIVVPPSPSFSIPPSYVPPSSGESSFNPSGTGSSGNDGNSGKGGKKSKLSTGAIIGIVIAIVVVVAVIVVLVVLLMRSRVNKNDVRSEQISQDADNSAYALESHVSTNEDENQPIWAANSMDANNVQENVDPFMKDFEEAVV